MKLFESDATPMQVIKTRLLRKYPWYGVLIQRLNIVNKDEKFFEDKGFEGCIIGTDGVSVFFVEEKFNKLKPNQQLFLMAQQVLRCVLYHFSRRNNREVKKWNVSGCIVANQMLVDEQMGEKPENEPYVEEFKGLSAEQVYLKLRDMSEKEQNKMMKGAQGCVMDAPSNSSENENENNEGFGLGETKESLEMKWKIAVEQAALTMKQRGLESAGMDRVLDKMRVSKIDWRDRVRQLLTVKGDSTWSKPNRRYIGRGMYLPSIKKSRLGHLVFAIDTSGSIDENMLRLFGGEINEILSACEEWPEKVSVMWADSQVCGVEEQEGVLELKPKGGGGTAFQPTFDYVEENEMEPQILFYLTDLCGDRPTMPSGYPVVWVVPEQHKEQYKNVGWGEMVVVDDIKGEE